MDEYEKFEDDCKAPVDLEQCYQALKLFITGKQTLHLPPRIDDADILLSRALRELKGLREQLKNT